MRIQESGNQEPVNRCQTKQLALHGGKPTRTIPLPYGRQSLDEDDIKAVEKVLRDPFITRGPVVQVFEEALAEFVQMPYAVVFSSGTAALHAAMALIGVRQNKKVVTSPLTFAATANAVLYCQGEVTFQDIYSDTMNLNPTHLQSIEPPWAVVAVDFAGNPCDYDALHDLQKSKGFHLIGDGAHSLGATYKNRPVGALADATVFSFHPVKVITSGEGGAVTVRDPSQEKFLKQFRDHGINRNSQSQMEFLGFNYHITDIQCALGLSQLKKLPSFLQRRREIAQTYSHFFKKFPFFKIPQETSGAQSAWHLYPLRLNLSKFQCSRDEFLKALQAENIGTQVHYLPVYWHPYYKKLGFSRGLCPQAEQCYQEEISLPIFPAMTQKDVEDVCQAVEKVSLAFSF